MIIDFNNIEEEKKMNVLGGKGELDAKTVLDKDNKIMLSRLKPGASTGLHKHEGNCEIMYIVEGEATFVCNGKEEIAKAGQVHYCPNGHSHYLLNKTEKDIVFFAIVPNLGK